MQIRKADAEEMLKLWGYADVSQASPTAKFFCRNISFRNAVFWTADLEGELIGELYAFKNIEEDKDFADGETTAYLCAFRVKKDYRCQGIGSRLMDAALSDLKTAGFRYATIGVSDDHIRKMYQHMGFMKEVKICHYDPCAMDENMQPEFDREGYWLLAKDL